jgi:hypothetical protein
LVTAYSALPFDHIDGYPVEVNEASAGAPHL